ncbi:MAG: glutaminyl-peptide cyclotransferase [Crocinitomicaceae bacterium]|nr:glutaminyl-peptide cyclotransferase [Crocinitomicaceae bacterium]
MKKYIVIGLIVLVGAAFIIGPMLKGSEGDDPTEDQAPATFAFEENLATKWNQLVPISIDVNMKDVKKLQLIYNDSVFKTWTAPKGKLTFQLDAGYFGLGTRSIVLLSTLNDGTTYTDNRMIRVLSDVKPAIWIAEIASTLPHLSTSFTQGLEFNEGVLYEGTGQLGQSMVAQVNLNSGEIIKKMGLDGTYFGEGITILKDKLYQLTWQNQKCFVYNKSTFAIEKDLTYTGEGWGLCNDGASLIMSDGTERIVFRNPETFQIERTIEVYDDRGPISKLNELEYIDGLIYANIWMTNSAVVIQPENGKVIAVIDGSVLIKEGQNGGDVMNGIAFNAKTSKTYMTGKNWSKLFEVRFKKPVV